MIIREFSVVCDGCGRVDQDKFAYSSDLKEDKRGSGWKFSNEAFCPKCANESNQCPVCQEILTDN
jgi:hypothetical protein